jgi:hypothetical protein
VPPLLSPPKNNNTSFSEFFRIEEHSIVFRVNVFLGGTCYEKEREKNKRSCT